MPKTAHPLKTHRVDFGAMVPDLSGDVHADIGSRPWWRAVCSLAAGLAVAIASSAGGATVDSKSGIRAEFSQIGDASHFEFEGTGADRYKIEKTKEGDVLLKIPSLSEADLNRLKSMKDKQVVVKDIRNQPGDEKIVIQFKPTAGVDYFDYVSDRPTRLVLDFFPAEQAPKDAKALSDSTGPQTEPKDEEKKPIAATEPNKKASSPSKTGRKPAGGDFVIVAKQGLGTTQLVAEAPSLAERIASRRDFERGIFDGGDPEFRRFTVKDYEVKESARFAARAALRIPYPMLDLGFPKLAELMDAPPIYEITPQDTKENKEARLILTLFKNKRQALLLSTAKDFLKQYPHSEYEEIIRYVMADTHYDLWMSERRNKEENKVQETVNLHDTDFEEAMGLYNSLVEKFPDSPLSVRTLLLVGYSFLEKGDSIGALKTFQKFVRLKPDSKFSSQVKISIARAFMTLNRWDDAVKELEAVEKTAKSPRDQQEAAFRKGDVYFKKGDYTKAIAAYDDAIKKNPSATGRFPNAFYNRAEAQFRTGQERPAIDSYRQFLQKFPEHRHGGFAMTRLGELIETLVGADDRRVTGAFFESYFRYRSTPGADIARIRVLISRIPKMKDRELKDALMEVDELVKRDSDLPSIQEFKTITLADALTTRGEYDRATRDLIQFYKENTHSKHLDLIKGRIIRNLSESIRESVEKRDFIQGLRLYSRDQSGWLKGSKRADLPFYAARAFEDAGVYAEAARYYREALQKVESTKPNERDVFEAELAPESLHLRLAAVSFKEKRIAETEAELKKMKDVERLSPKEKVERASLASSVAEERGQTEEARKYLADMIKLYSGDQKTASVLSPLHLRMAKLALKAKDHASVEKSVDQVIKLTESTKQESEEEDGSSKAAASAHEDVVNNRENDVTRAAALEIRAQSRLQRGLKKEGIAALKSILEIPLVQSDAARKGYDSVRYQLGQLYFETGDLKSAEKVWTELSPAESNVWKKLASEQMSGAKWREEYKKYIQRIPAAAEIR